MCIICNVTIGQETSELGSEFLNDFETARKAMSKAALTMARCAQIDKRYDRTHKKMIKILRAWNKLEQSREHERGCMCKYCMAVKL